jgi:hypothetical protein
MTRQIRNCDQGSAYAAALLGYDRAGASKASDAQLMAGFCEDTLQTLMGAFSPRLVWEGAQREGMTALALAALCTPKTDAQRRKANARLDDLQFGAA